MKFAEICRQDIGLREKKTKAPKPRGGCGEHGTRLRRLSTEHTSDCNNSRKQELQALRHVLGMRFHILLLEHQHLVFEAKF